MSNPIDLKNSVVVSYGWMQAYGCVKCQTYHFEDEEIYQEHIYYQSKHSISRREKIEFAPAPHKEAQP